MLKTELKELLEFLAVHQPLTDLSSDALREYASKLSLSYHKRGTIVLSIGASNNTLYMIRSGAVALYDNEKNLITKLAEGKFFGYLSVLGDKQVQLQTVCVEDCLLIECSKSDFNEFRINHPVFEKYFTQAFGERIRKASHAQVTSPLSLTDVRGILTRAPVCIQSGADIQSAATVMASESVSALLIMQNEQLTGIVTDKDLRKRVVAQGLDVTLPVTDIMTSDPNTISVDESVAAALLHMMQKNIHHLPVVDAGIVKGVITVNDIVRVQADHPVFMVGDISKQNNVDGLVAVSKRVPELFSHLVKMDAKASDVGRMLTMITDAITQRLLVLAFAQFGDPPIAYAWLALGSQARREQTAKTDQDNALVLASDATQEHKDYFLKVANFVNTGLDACGYVYCPGEVMANNPKWCQSVDEWKNDFRHWIMQPEPKALMHVNIFFDLRCIEGDESLITQLQEDVAKHAELQQIFLGLLYKNALGFQPPIGFFRQFVLDKKGEHKDRLDLKHHGLVPIVDLARIYMLSSGQSEEHTLKRLELAASVGAIPYKSADNLRDAFEFISYLRIQHQGRQLSQGIKPDNYISPKELSPLLRDQLRSAFDVVAESQKALGQRFPGI